MIKKMLYQELICTFPKPTTRYVRRNEDYYMLTLKSSYIKHKTNIYSFFKKAAAITGAVVITACSFSACTPFGGSASRYNNADEQYNAADNESFNAFTDSLFRELASSDSLSLHALLENPSEYGIDDYDITLGRIDIDNIDDTSDITDYITKLNAFNKASLSKSQQITYDLLNKYLYTTLNYSDLYLLNTDLTPTIGIQIQLPLLFSEYTFMEKKDVEEYIQLLSDVDGYFNNLLEFEALRSVRGYTLSDDLLDEVISSCKSIADSAGDAEGMFIGTFNSRVDDLIFLTDDEKNVYKKQNEDAVINHVIPGYNALITTLASFKGTNQYSGGICNYPDGARYFEGLLENCLGWSKSIDEYNDLLDSYIRSYAIVMQKLLRKDPSLNSQFGTFSFGIDKPDQIIEDLKKKITDDYPALSDVNYNINYVSEALNDYASPAMYFMPQIDNLDINSIYINSTGTDSSDLYPTLAHEGYPGHLYQTQYFASTRPSLIRNVIKPGGYIEGWASYVEVHSYEYAGDNTLLNSLVQCNYALILCLYAKGDIGVNYYGWTEAQLSSFLTDYGFNSAEAAHEMYTAFIANPANYCKYVLGFLGFEELKKQAQKDLGDNFSLKEFHRYILETGPVHIDILFDYLKNWENRLVVSSRAA